MTSGANLNATSSTHFIFNYININAVHLATQPIVETLTYYGKNEDLSLSAVLVCANFEFNGMFAQNISWVRVLSPGGAVANEM